MFPEEILAFAEQLVETLNSQGKMIVTAESCTGGLIVGALTEVAGSSGCVHGGFVTYANQAKQQMIGVSAASLEQYGAVSEQVAREMAEGALQQSEADISIAVTGIAGPAGGTPDKPVGLVHFACATSAGTAHQRVEFGDPGRQTVRLKTIKRALILVIETLQTAP